MIVVGVKQQRWLVLLILCLFVASSSDAQLPPLGGLPADSALPRGVSREGQTETSYVILEGLPLFKIASPVVLDRSRRGSDIPVEVRAQHIGDDLEEFLQILIREDRKAAQDQRTPLESGTNTITIETLKGQTILVAQGNGLSHPKTLLVVTPLDALSEQQTQPLLAFTWRQKLIDALSESVRSHRPEALRERTVFVRSIVIGMIIVQGLLFAVNRLLLRWQKRLREAGSPSQPSGIAETNPASAFPTVLPSPRLFGRELTLHTRFRITALLRWLVFWGMFALWLGGIALCLVMFPATRVAAAYLMATPLMIVSALFVAGLVNRVTDLMVDGFIANWRGNQFLQEGGTGQVEARVTTISAVIRALKFFCVYAIAIVWVLSRLEFVPWSLVTISAAGALALSFAVQSLIKDAVMGVLILVENQFALGDHITIGETTGIVEYMNLRITRLRATDGRLITIPNNLITKVENLSRSWSISIVEFDVPLSANADQVLEEARRIAKEMAQEAEWANIIIDADKWSGVSRISHDAMTMVIAVQTKPAQHGMVSRELRLRIKNALDAQGINWRGFTDSAEAE